MKLNERGQVLLAVILIAVVALTIGLSLVSRSITGVRVATQSEDSQSAFQAAEAGVERALNEIEMNSTIPLELNDSFSNDATYETSVSTIGNQQAIHLNGGNELEQDVGSDVWLSEYPDYTNPMNGNFRVFFGSSNQADCTGSGLDVTPAIEILVLTGNVNSPTLTKYIVDPCNRIPGSVLQSGSGGSLAGVNYRYNFIFPINLGGLIARVIPIYNSTIVGMEERTAQNAFPPQGSVIQSIGKSGESVRKIQVFQSHPQIPIELFQYAILSQ